MEKDETKETMADNPEDRATTPEETTASSKPPVRSTDLVARLEEAESSLFELLGYVLEDYYPNCATQEYKAAVDRACDAAGIGKCIGRGYDGCGWRGGVSGGTCPKCNGMVLTQKHIDAADGAQRQWEAMDRSATRVVARNQE